MKNMYRQGDILLTRIDVLPENLTEIKGDVIVYGTATGHAHKLVDGTIFSDEKGNLYLTTKKDGKVIHEEHDTIELGKGFWAVKRQREYTPEAIRTVID